jgi:hypothetical protein
MNGEADFFVAGGTLRTSDPSYVTRPADTLLLQHLQAGEFCYVLTARQMGKSSLMVRTAQRLRTEGARVAIIDLTSIGANSTAVSPDQWYLGLLSRLRSELRLSTNVQKWWQERSAFGIAQRFLDFLHDVVLTECFDNVVILIDEIDSTLNLNFRDDFFAAIRAIYNGRASDPSYSRLTFALFGVATPTDLIQDRERTPFNIGQRIDLREFTYTDATPLQDGLSIVFAVFSEPILQRILYWTSGHPYLTQKLCQAVMTRSVITWGNDGVDAVVQEVFFSEEGRKDPNLTFAHDRIVNSCEEEKRQMLRLYRRVRRGERVADDDRSAIQNRLELYGLVGVTQGMLQVRNRIYEPVFTLAWIDSVMPVNRQQRTAIWAVVIAMLLFISATTFLILQPDPTCSELQTLFDNNTTNSSIRLSALAGLFRQEDSCRTIALELFYRLEPQDQIALFVGLSDPQNEQAQLVTVIDGVYRTLDTVPEHDLKLMDIWLNVLRNAGLNEDDTLVSSIHNWKVGRKFYLDSEYKRAASAFYKVTVQDHPVISYDRALTFIAQENYEAALQNLGAIIEIADKLPAIPTPEFNFTGTENISPDITNTLSRSVKLTEVSSTDQPIVQPRASSSPEDNSLKRLTAVGYKLRFNSPDKLRRIVRRTLEDNPQLGIYLLDRLGDYPSLMIIGSTLVFDKPIIHIVQTGPGLTDSTITSALVFQVQAYDPTVGRSNGDGIDNVSMQIIGPDGVVVHEKIEVETEYCAFGREISNCKVWVFANHNNRWPSIQIIKNGPYTLQVVANAIRGVSTKREVGIKIRLHGSSDVGGGGSKPMQAK